MDADAAAYITAVETADTESLEGFVKNAIDAFVVGCKADGVWSSIKASCLLAGPRTLAGALVPLVGSAPTNVDGNFVSADYNRLTGLKGNGTSKYLDSNRASDADLQNSQHLAFYSTEIDTAGSGTASIIGEGVTGDVSHIAYDYVNVRYFFRSRSNAVQLGTSLTSQANGLLAVSRTSSTNVNVTLPGFASSVTYSSAGTSSNNVRIFARGSTQYYSGRCAFYSIGEAIGLAALDARIAAYLFDIANPPEGNAIDRRKRLLRMRGYR
jgi:hypothetical protein